MISHNVSINVTPMISESRSLMISRNVSNHLCTLHKHGAYDLKKYIHNSGLNTELNKSARIKELINFGKYGFLRGPPP